VVGTDGIGPRPKRIEPDFVVFKGGRVTIVEIDGGGFHPETPTAAHLHLKFLMDEGSDLERINAAECDTEHKAREVAERILAGIEKRRASR
jgi:very-short-patch-repair endonuclease